MRSSVMVSGDAADRLVVAVADVKLHYPSRSRKTAPDLRFREGSAHHAHCQYHHPEASCLRCGKSSARVHSRYVTACFIEDGRVHGSHLALGGLYRNVSLSTGAERSRRLSDDTKPTFCKATERARLLRDHNDVHVRAS